MPSSNWDVNVLGVRSDETSRVVDQEFDICTIEGDPVHIGKGVIDRIEEIEGGWCVFLDIEIITGIRRKLFRPFNGEK
jgi:hypothetical protein